MRVVLERAQVAELTRQLKALQEEASVSQEDEVQLKILTKEVQ